MKENILTLAFTTNNLKIWLQVFHKTYIKGDFMLFNQANTTDIKKFLKSYGSFFLAKK